MLEQMRNLSSVFSKSLLGLIALSFILFYGYGTISRRSGQGHALIAKVNDEGIPVQKFSNEVQKQNNLLQQFGQSNLSPELQQTMENQVLQRLIGATLLSQAAYTLGIRVPDVELADEIRKNPTFQIDGRFNEDGYLNKFKPWYEHQNGSDYEYDLRQEMLAKKLIKVLDSATVVSQNEVQNQLKLEGISLQVKKIAIPLQGPAGSTGLAFEDARKIALEWINNLKEKKNSDELLKAHSLKEETGESQTLVQLQAGFGREDSLPVLTCLLSLKPGEVCDSPFQVGPLLVAVQLLDRKETPPDAAKVDAMTHQLSMGEKSQLVSGVVDLLTKKATIHTYMANKGR